MIKYTIVFLNMLALILFRTFFAEDVSVKMQLVPDRLKKGDVLTVSFTINKGSITGVGHMKQELPPVFGNATVIDAKGGEFKYLAEDNVVKFTWISLPADKEFVVSYKLTVNADAPDGRVNLGGKFSYVLNNEKQTSMVTETSILIGNEVLASATQPETTATAVSQPESTAVAIQKPDTSAVKVPAETTTAKPDTTATNTSQTELTSQVTTKPETVLTTSTSPTEAKTTVAVTASRTIVGSPEAGTEFTVEVNVKKDGMKGFARIQETLPAGLTAQSLDSKGGTFSFMDQKVKIIWDNLPADEDVKVSYRVLVSENSSGNMTITGSFSYVENDDPKKAEIIPTDIFVKGKTTVPVTATATTTPTGDTNTAGNTTPPVTTQTSANNTTTPVVPAPDNTVMFKVQICALSKIQRGTSYFESKYAIGNKVSMEFHEGWKKYIVGKYDQYKNARDFRESMRSKGIENPFVIAYNSGKRITVQEALMVSSQQWIR